MTHDLVEQHLILMKGFPATGKSLLAHCLSRSLGWPVIDKDDIKDHTLLLERGNELAYEIMWSVTERQLLLGLSVIVDSPLTYPIAFETGSALAAKTGAHLLVVETVLDETTWRARLNRRKPAESEHKIASWADMQAMLERYNGCWRFAIPSALHIQVDATQPVAAITCQVLDRLADQEHAQQTAGPESRATTGSQKHR
jgi:predicted kinase